MRLAALVTLLCFGCATARRPSSPEVPLAGAPPARVALAEPDLELWLEGTQRPRPEESARALDESRAALAAALEDRGLDGVEEPDALLFASVRAVARTGERRAAQTWSAVAIVGVVAIVIAAIVLSRDRPKPQRAPAVASPVRRGALPVHAVRPRLRAAPPPSFFWGFSVGVHAGLPAAPPPGAASPYPAPALDPLLDDRGWWDGDEVELTLELVDPATGDVRWRRAVRDMVDPRDGEAMTRLVDRALEGSAFGRRGTPAPGALPQGPGGAAPEGLPPASAPGPEPIPDVRAEEADL
jgi:hypothetical protein